ncbi:MAG: efflux RND transporter periplasmic adaptor subunit [Candidatus Binatia bacterium]
MKEVQKRAASVHELQPAPEPHAPRAPRRRGSVVRRVVLYGVLALLAAAGTIFGIKTVLFYSHHVETDDAQVEGHIDPVLPRVAGYITAVRVSDNQHVTAGDELVRIDPHDFESRVSMARAAVDNARAAVTVAQAKVESARSKSTKAAQDLTRAAALREQKVVSAQEFDAAKAAADAAAADYNATVREVSATQAQVAQRQADLDYATLQLSYTAITAPMNGVVSKKSVEIGQYVQAGQPLMAVVEDQDVWVVANFKETQLRRMHVGQPVEVQVDAYPHVVFRGRVDSIGAATGAKFSLLPPDNATGNFVKVVQRIPVKVLFTDPPDGTHPLRVGMDVTAIVDLQ